MAGEPVDPDLLHRGSCLCGAVQFTVTGPLPPIMACHCSMCRKHTGHYEAGTDVPRDRVGITGTDAISWYQSSEKVRRGFCRICGSSLFFDPVHADWIGIMMGAFDTPTHAKLSLHIFVADKGDYYEISDGLPQNQQ
ncbi:GFA family protein [Devosia sp.]|uniref:GFA family protein n=1 Tax=Devosia sp. TaxID=1871048 RepID=UPI0032671EEB